VYFDPTTFPLSLASLIILANNYLKPSDNEQWVCPDIIDFPSLENFANKDNKLASYEFISTSIKSPHPESMLVCLLYCLQSPAPCVIPQWAKIVAAHIELMADNLYKPPPPQRSDKQDAITQGVHVLQFLKKLKSSSSSFDMPDKIPPATGTAIGQHSNSVDVLHDFRNTIIDVFMGYIIFQTHFFSSPLRAQKQKKRNTPQTSASSASGDLPIAATNQTLTDLAN
jgi:hypothetical protein